MIEFDDEQDKVENLNNELGSAYIGVSKETNRYRDFQAVYKTSAGKKGFERDHVVGSYQPSLSIKIDTCGPLSYPCI